MALPTTWISSIHSLMTMTTELPTDLQLMELYREWWKDSYGSVPNSQATIVAAAWAKHVLATLPQGGAND